jgi:hypothetical protein
MRYLQARREEPTIQTDKPDIMVTSDSDEGSGGVNSLRAKIREFQPTLVVVDAFYLMNDDRENKRGSDWKVMTNISRDLRKTASNFKIPLIGVTQGNRGADKDHKQADLREIGYADAPGQDADLTMRVDKKKDPQTKETELILSFPGTRHAGKLDAFSIYFHPCVDMRQKHIISADDPASSPPPPTSGGGAGRRASPPSVNSAKWKKPGGRA